MFTGIIEELGTVAELGQGVISVNAAKVIKNVELGESIAVNGVCLTVSSSTKTSFSANVMEETLKKTNLGSLEVGSQVNLERALRMGDRIGGHLVSGHIDGPGIITRIEQQTHSTVVTIEPSEDMLPYIAPKGSIAIDGVSLTVVDVSSAFTVSLVKHTLENTNLGSIMVGSAVNLETDMLAKYVRRMLEAQETDGEATSVEKLFKQGFLS